MSEHTIEQFHFEEHQLRVITRDSEPWFIAFDVCQALGLSNGRKAVGDLDEDEKSSVTISDGTQGNPNRAIISEAGLYSLVLRSRKPEAKAFKRWVTHEVLPSIRQTGRYEVEARRELTPDEIVNQALQITSARVKALEEENQVLAPKAQAWDEVIGATGSMSFRDAAKVLHEHGVISIGGNRLIEKCIRWGWLYRPHTTDPSKTPAVRAKQTKLEQGVFVEKASTYTDRWTGEKKISTAPQVRVTGKGIDAIRRKLVTTSVGEQAVIEGVAA